MALRAFVSAIACIVGLMLTSSFASALTTEEAIGRFFSAEELEREWFAPSFLQVVGFERLEPIRAQLTQGLGEYRNATPEDDRYMAHFEGGRIPVYASLDAEGRFVGLRLLLPIPKLDDLEEVQTKFGELPGSGHLLVSVNGEDRIALRADESFAIGSAFKLLVLKVLVDEIERGERAWEDVVELKDIDRPMRNGTLASWPDGSPLTLHSAAVLMISESDNTATDLLIRVLGRDRIGAADSSGRNRPFLTTREAFQLKDPRNQEWLERWRGGDEAQRASVLEELRDRPLPGAEIFAEGTPVTTDVEWFFTARELCVLIAALQSLDLMTVNPGVVQEADFDRVAYKGGSEPGVLNFTTWARDERGREICVCATRNAEEAIQLNELAEVVTGAFEVLGKD